MTKLEILLEVLRQRAALKAQENYNPFEGPDKRYGGGQPKDKKKKKKKEY